jgi:protein-L-isoaspartate(D-aspartate) O-methyltransferase
MADRSRLPLLLLVFLGVAFLGGVVALIVLRSGPAASPGTPASASPAAAGPATVAAAATTPAPSGPAYDLRKRTDHPPLDSQEDWVRWMLANSPEEEKYLRAKWARAQKAVEWKEIRSDRVLEAFLRTPRQEFARTRNVAVVYEHMVLDIGYGQTISGPHLVAKMTDVLSPEPEHKVLEIGTGSGYQSAVLAELSNHVYTIEIVPELAAQTDGIYKSLYPSYPQYQNITRKEDDGYYGWAEHAPFDRIVVTCGIDHIPPELLKQLTVGGAMIIPVGPPSGQTILKVTKTLDSDGNVLLEREDLYGGRLKEVFVPFTARGGGVHSQARDGQKENP